MPDQPDKPKSTDLRFQCPKCNGKIVVDASAVGFYANCPHCNTRILIKRQMPAAVPAQPPATPKPPATKPAPADLKPAPAPQGLMTTQKISDAAKPQPPVAAKPILVTTQKIGSSSATMKGLAIGAPTPVPPTPAKLEPVKPAPDAAAEEARQSLTNLIEGLKRENKELKRRLATAGSATATVHGLTVEAEPATLADAVAEANKELAKLRERLAGLEEIHREDEVAASLLRSQLDSARTSADHFKRTAEEAITRNRTQQANIAETDTELRHTAGRANALQSVVSRSASRAMDLEQERATLIEDRARLSRELSEASLARDLAATDRAHARQALRVADDEHRRTEADLKQACEAANDRAASLTQQLAATDEKLRAVETQLAAAPKPDQLQKLNDEAEQLRGSLAALSSELAGLRMSEQAFRNHHATTTAELAALRTEAASGSTKAVELQKAVDGLKAEQAAALEKSRALQAKLDRLAEENERLHSEKSALVLAFDEAKDRAQQLDGEKWRADELARKLESLKEENEAVNEQLTAANQVAADMKAGLKRIDELEVENNKLREQIKKTEHEIAMRASPHGLELVESRFRRRIEELESTVSTASSVTHSLRARIAELEKDQRRVPLPDQDATRAQDEKLAAVQKQLFEAESLARKMQAERDAANSARIEAEAAVDALSGQARDLQDHLDALNKKIAGTPAAAAVAEIPQPSPRKTKHGSTQHGETKSEPAPPPPPAAKPQPVTELVPRRANSKAGVIAIILALASGILILWYAGII